MRTASVEINVVKKRLHLEFFPSLCLSLSQVERDNCSPNNVTLGYYVASGKTVYISSLVVEALNVYGFDKLLSDIRQHTPLVKAVLVPVATWVPSPSIHLQLKTGDET